MDTLKRIPCTNIYNISTKDVVGPRHNERCGVVYTCITGDYDNLCNHTYVNPKWDYVCFTDNPKIKNSNNSNWKLSGLVFAKLDNIRNQRWHKMHPHLVFESYDRSLYLDANIDILNKEVFNDVEKAMTENRKMSIPLHPDRDCVYDEFEACIALGKDNQEIMQKQMEIMRKFGLPKKQGLFETNVIYRQHHDEIVVAIMEDWWWWIENYSRRDQLSLGYVLWKKGIEIKALSDRSYRNRGCVAFNYETHCSKDELIVKLQDEIRRMKLSKFWQMREMYVRVRRCFSRK